MTNARRDELKKLWKAEAETGSLDARTWREDLSAEERLVVLAWDEYAARQFTTLLLAQGL